ncbi:polysaccharide biosynthesis tyrosine autokinase [uncultured Methylibium sp.]|uniref:polysaccharide biosynthesis tyrosine autokinase n=1 Tax=uncultured Methylibium sp. TaxID=381093 RepID=UPI0025D45D31|nr:polysaccharide biosynthesis tyrosine autokinase [uncultured Methylibium sp.]
MSMVLPAHPARTGHGATPPTDAEATDPMVLDRSIGDFLRRARSLSDGQIEQILQHQRKRGIRFGEAAVALKLATPDEVLWALSQQFHYPYALDHAREFNEELVVAIEPFGQQAEVFREIRSQLMMGVLAPEQRRSALAIVSCDPGDGKSFFAANMAIAFSQLGGRTLVIDADMRTPRQHELFRVPNEAGLSNVLSNRSDSNLMYRVPELPSLYVLPVGTVPPNPLELLQRPAFGLLMQELMGKFDHIVVDTPAASSGADARVIASRCGAALLLGRRGRTRMRAIEPLLHALQGVTRVAGVTMNDY